MDTGEHGVSAQSLRQRLQACSGDNGLLTLESLCACLRPPDTSLRVPRNQQTCLSIANRLRRNLAKQNLCPRARNRPRERPFRCGCNGTVERVGACRAKFTAIVDEPIMVHGETVVARGTTEPAPCSKQKLWRVSVTVKPRRAGLRAGEFGRRLSIRRATPLRRLDLNPVTSVFNPPK